MGFRSVCNFVDGLEECGAGFQFSFPAFSFLIAGWLERKMPERKIRGSMRRNF